MKCILPLVFAAASLAQMPTPGIGRERTMSRLAASDGADPSPVRIVFYGQSSTNRAIGGYSTQFLIRTMEADIAPFHPDLVIFYDYGDEDLYEKTIHWIRANTSAEILLQNDHVGWLPGDDDPNGGRKKSSDWQDRHSEQ